MLNFCAIYTFNELGHFVLTPLEDRKIVEAYGVWGPKKFMGREYDGIHRTTFLIGKTGMIEAVIAKPDSKNHAAEILDALASLK